MLKVLAEFDDWQDSEVARSGVEAALTLWEERRERHPYLFYMGTDFSKLKAPLIWYDILHVTERQALIGDGWGYPDESRCGWASYA